jgi:hypothetical protein
VAEIAETHERTPLENLILARLLPTTKKGPSLGELRKGLRPLWEHQGTTAELQAAFEGALSRLRKAGQLNGPPFVLTESGRRSALDFLGLDQAPSRLRWTDILNTHLVARVLGVSTAAQETRKRIGQADSLRGYLLKQHFGLTGAAVPTARQAARALIWKELGIESDKKVTEKALVGLILGRILDPKGLFDADKAEKQLAARAVGARTTGPNDLRIAAVKRWFEQSEVPVVASGPAPSTIDLATFAGKVTAAALASPNGRYGDHKVFIAHVWRRLQETNALPPMTEAGFKDRLIEANRQGLIRLSRADLVEAMDPADVRASETTWLNAVFHFVEI